MDKAKRVLLIVDDEAGMRDMLRWNLVTPGYVVVTARDGAEARALLEAGGVDLVVTDITMPGQGGFAVLEAAARTVPKTPVIVMTGFGTVEMAVHAMKNGASDFLLKPFDVSFLAARIQEAFAVIRPASPASVAPS